jgi:hypothetical protein
MIRIFLQSPYLPDMAVVMADATTTPDQVKMLCMDKISEHLRTADLELFDEADADRDESMGADEDEATPRQEKSAGGRSRRVHLGRCKHIAVKVRYAGAAVERTFPPTATIERVKKWATRELKISPQDATELALQLAGTETQPPRDKHVGCFVGQDCAVIFDLVRAYTVNGDSNVDSDHVQLLSHLESGPFLSGVDDGRWTLREINWPFVLVDVVAFNGDVFTLRLQCDSYPALPPTGTFWDVVSNTRLAASCWPRTTGRGGQALRTDWHNGAALYIPCDRLSISGHDQWAQIYPAWLWDSKVGLTRYLHVVSELISDVDYVSPNA